VESRCPDCRSHRARKHGRGLAGPCFQLSRQVRCTRRAIFVGEAKHDLDRHHHRLRPEWPFGKSQVSIECGEPTSLRYSHVGADDLVIAFPVADLGLRKGVKYDKVSVPSYSAVRASPAEPAIGLKSWIERDVELRCQDFFRIKGVVVTKPLQDFTGFTAGLLHQRVEYFRSVERLFLTRWLTVPTQQSSRTGRAYEHKELRRPCRRGADWLNGGALFSSF
jgi:hypothetical protein